MMGTDMFSPPELAGAGADHRPGGHLRLARTQADCGELLTIQAEHRARPSGRRCASSNCPRWWTCPPPGCGSCWPAAGLGVSAPGGVWVHPAPRALRGGAGLKHLPDRELRACSYSMIRAKRIAHVKGTEEAVRLARRWGADEEHARRAAILHDCTKLFGTGRAVAIMREMVSYWTNWVPGRQAPPLKTGACVARHVYGVSDDIYEAISGTPPERPT